MRIVSPVATSVRPSSRSAHTSPAVEDLVLAGPDDPRPPAEGGADRGSEEVDGAVRGEHPAQGGGRGEPAGRVDQGGHQPRVQEAGVLAELVPPRQPDLDPVGIGGLHGDAGPAVPGSVAGHCRFLGLRVAAVLGGQRIGGVEEEAAGALVGGDEDAQARRRRVRRRRRRALSFHDPAAAGSTAGDAPRPELLPVHPAPRNRPPAAARDPRPAPRRRPRPRLTSASPCSER